MDKGFLSSQKKKLEAEKKEVEKELKGIVEGGEISNNLRVKYPELGSNSEDDNAEEVETYMENIDIEGYLENILKDINNALAKIENGTYGLCEKCSKKISKARLEAYPVATLCLDDQNKQEKKRFSK